MTIEDDIIAPSEQKEPPVIDDGLYPVICRTVIATERPDDKFGNTHKLRFGLEIEGEVNENGEPLMIDPLVTRKLTAFGKGSNLYKYALAFGLLAAGEERALKMSEFVGKRARALIRTPGEGKWPRVEEIMPPVKRQGQRTASTQENGSASSGAPQQASPVVGATDPVEEISAWWAMTRKIGLERKEVIEQSKFTYDGREPADLTPEERDTIVKMLNP